MKVRAIFASIAVAASCFAASAADAQPLPPPAEDPARLGAPAPFDAGREEIESFFSRLSVHQDGTMTVDETIDYNFPSAKHGIYRDIPVRYDIDGKTVEMPLGAFSVRAPDGEAIPYVTKRNKDSVRIKIGDPNVTVTGVRAYVIEYSVSGALRYFGDHDELYWNVTGNGWDVPIRKSGAQVVLPDAVDAKSITTRCFTGGAGSTAQDCLGRPQGPGASFVANGPLTVVVGWNKGVVQTLLPKEVGFFDSHGNLLPFLLPVLVLIGLIAVWAKKGRDPAGRGTIMVQYEPPGGMTPVEVGGLCKEDVSNSDVSAIIVSLAVRGYLLIAETEKKGLLTTGADYEFRRLKDYANDSTLQPYEKLVLDTLFGGTGMLVRVSEISEQHLFYKQMQPVKNAVFARLVEQGYFPSDPAKIKAGYYGVGIMALFGLFFFGNVSDAFSGTFFGNVFLAIAVSAVLVMFFAHLMPRRTPKGVAAYEAALGFKDYVSTAEKYRLQWQEKEHIFENFLPYAMVFGVVAKWSKAFENMNLPKPEWYQGSAFSAGAFNAAAFSSAFGSMDRAMSSAMISRPSSSSGGSGFGGSSGGGGGGGGGGSW